MPKPRETFTEAQFLTIIWTLSSLALVLLAVRLVIRLKVYGRLMVDDGLVILAIICLLATDIINTAMLSKTYVIQNVQINHFLKPSHYQEIADSYAKYQWANAYLFFTGIWAVKGSFLAYYEDLTKRLTSFRRAWWLTIIFTTLTYIGSLFAYAFLDGINFKTNLRNEAIKYQFAADLFTDVLIMIISLLVALKSQIPLRQKLALVGIFSLSLIITIFSIVRFTLNSPSRGTAGPSWLQAWSAIEQSVSVTVASLASFRVFVIHKRCKSAQSSARECGKNKSSSAFLNLQSHRGDHLMELRENRSMEFQLLDTTSLRSPAQAATSLKHEESRNTI